jgi:magnesium chelatase family protein
MSDDLLDLLVIGGGPGGYVAAIRGAQLGMNTALVEREHLGGICSNWGCIPTKALLHTASVYRQIQHAGALGIEVQGVSFDFGKLVQRSRAVADRMNRGVRHLLKKNKVALHEGEGRIVGPQQVEVAAAGGHHVLMVGPPGTGKSLLAARMPTILPPMTLEEAIEATRVHSCAGLLPAGEPILRLRPFRSPHHTISYAGMTGGGQNIQPGEISLAHQGVLFLDELTEFRRDVLEALRQPLEDGRVTITRAAQSLTFPCAFLLLSAMNPCPCGFLGHPSKPCRCTPNQIKQYQGRISGPLLDRVDLTVEVPALSFDEMDAPEAEEGSAAIRDRVLAARERQARRFSRSRVRVNGRMGPSQIQKHCALGPEARTLLKTAADRFSLSGRGLHRVLKTARTIADLEGAEAITPSHVAEALQFRFSRYFES